MAIKLTSTKVINHLRLPSNSTQVFFYFSSYVTSPVLCLTAWLNICVACKGLPGLWNLVSFSIPVITLKMIL